MALLGDWFLEDGASGAWRCRSSQYSMYKLQNSFGSTVVGLIISQLKSLKLEVKEMLENRCCDEEGALRVLRCSLNFLRILDVPCTSEPCKNSQERVWENLCG